MGSGGAMTAAGTALSVYGDIQSAQEQANADYTRAAVARAQSAELAQRETANDAIRATQVFKSKLDFGAMAAGSGHEGTGLGSQLEIQRQGDLATLIADRDAAFQEKMLEVSAQMETSVGQSTAAGGYIRGAASILGASSSANRAGGGSPGASENLFFTGG